MMMMMQRFEPLTDGVSLREAMERLFERSVVVPGAVTGCEGVAGAMVMPVDVLEKDSEFIIRAYVPGAKAENVEVGSEGETVTIRARIPDMAESDEAKSWKWLASELGHGEVARTVTLPMPIDAAKIEASVESGVLTVAVPKAEEAKPRKIEVKAK